MKKLVLIITALCMMLSFAINSSIAAEKALIVYFSWSGNTENVAKNIAEATGFDLFEIKTAKAYPEDYDAVLDLAKKEQNRNV